MNKNDITGGEIGYIYDSNIEQITLINKFKKYTLIDRLSK